jgi:hypothetical protein
VSEEGGVRIGASVFALMICASGHMFPAGPEAHRLIWPWLPLSIGQGTVIDGIRHRCPAVESEQSTIADSDVIRDPCFARARTASKWSHVSVLSEKATKSRSCSRRTFFP